MPVFAQLTVDRFVTTARWSAYASGKGKKEAACSKVSATLTQINNRSPLCSVLPAFFCNVGTGGSRLKLPPLANHARIFPFYSPVAVNALTAAKDNPALRVCAAKRADRQGELQKHPYEQRTGLVSAGGAAACLAPVNAPRPAANYADQLARLGCRVLTQTTFVSLLEKLLVHLRLWLVPTGDCHFTLLTN